MAYTPVISTCSSEFPRNRRDQLLEQLDRQLLLSGGDGARVALLVFNLQRFREINMSCGHAAGDTLLRLVAERIHGALRPCDSLFHIGNDEFAVLLTRLKSPQVVGLAAQKILDSIDADYELSGGVVSITAVAGGAVFPDHAADRDGLLRGADTALHLAREREQDFLIYNASLVSKEQQLANLKRNLSRALDNNELILHYQPQIDLQRGQFSGCEALVRWNHAEQGWIPPDVFIPVAEKSELIDTLTYWSMNVALREWLDFCVHCRDGAIAVNLSARLLQSAGLTVEIFPSGDAYLERPPFDGHGCIVLDVCMTGLSGTELQTRLAASGCDLPIIFLTGHGSIPMGVGAMKKGAVDFLAKPFDDEELIAAIALAELATVLQDRLNGR